MKQLMLNSTIYKYEDCKTFCREFRIGKDDLIITNKIIYDNYLKYNVNTAAVLFKENYGVGEPSDKMVEAMYENIKRISYERVIAIGGGAILDIGKLFALRNVCPVKELCNYKLEIIKEKELILVPTTCGSGSEVTNLAILELKEEKIKTELISDELYGDSTIMIPELLKSLPSEFLIDSSINTLTNAIETYLSVRATSHTRIFSLCAIEIILNGYKKIVKNGIESRKDMLEDFLMASNYSGIALSNTGLGIIQAMSYPLGLRCGIPNAKAKYIVFTEIFNVYQKVKPNGSIKELNKVCSHLLGCDESMVYEEIMNLLNDLSDTKCLKEYGVSEESLEKFVDEVLEKQKRLINNNYIKLDGKQIYDIYKVLY